MRPESVIATSDAEPREKVIYNCPDGGSASQGYILCGVKTVQGDEDDKSGREPVDVLVPVLHSEGLFTDVHPAYYCKASYISKVVCVH
jgi:hypothetical protein